MPRRIIKPPAILGQGVEPRLKLDLLFQLTSCRSEDVKSAVYDHLMEGRGFDVGESATINGVKHSNVVRMIDTLNSVARILEKYTINGFLN